MPRNIVWAAGLFEGEGTITWRAPRQNNREQNPTLALQLSSVDKDVVDEFHRIMGAGKVYGPYQYGERQPFWKWAVHKRSDAQGCLNRLKPYLLSRRANGAEYVGDKLSR